MSTEIWPVKGEGVRVDITDNSYHTVVGQWLFRYDTI